MGVAYPGRWTWEAPKNRVPRAPAYIVMALLKGNKRQRFRKRSGCAGCGFIFGQQMIDVVFSLEKGKKTGGESDVRRWAHRLLQRAQSVSSMPATPEGNGNLPTNAPSSNDERPETFGFGLTTAPSSLDLFHPKRREIQTGATAKDQLLPLPERAFGRKPKIYLGRPSGLFPIREPVFCHHCSDNGLASDHHCGSSYVRIAIDTGRPIGP